MIPPIITAEHIQEAMQIIDAVGFPKENRSRRYCLVGDTRHFPSKYTIALAHSVITGDLFDLGAFSGGDETKRFLRDRDFKVIRCGCGGYRHGADSTLERESDMPQHGTPRANGSILPVAGPDMTHLPTSSRTPHILRAALVFPSLKTDGPKIPTESEFVCEDVDFVLFPEGFIYDKKHYKVLKKLASDIDAPLLVGFTRDIKGRHAQSLLCFKPDGSEPDEIYTKHSTAGIVAFELDDWNPQDNLPTFDLEGVQSGATICHDHYLGLLSRFLAKSGARIWLNPSYDNVLDAKWSPVLRLRAVENRIFALCTFHDNPERWRRTHPFAFSPDGNELCARIAGSADARPISHCKEPDTIYIVDLDISSAGKQLDWSCLSRAGTPPKPNEKPKMPIRISIREGLPAVLAKNGRWSAVCDANQNCIQTRHAIIHVGIVYGSEILDAAACFQVIDDADRLGCRPIIWNHWDCLPTTEPDRMGHLLKGRVIECCAPIVVSDRDGIHELVELSNSEKFPVRRPVKSSDVMVDVGRAWGLASAFKPVAENIHSSSKTDVLEMYKSLR